MATTNGYLLDAGFKGLFASLGVHHVEVLRRAGLPEDLLGRADPRVSRDQYFAFAHAVQDAVDDPLFPLRLVERIRADTFSPPLFAALCSPNLTTAVARLARFKPLIAPVEMDVSEGADALRVAYRWLDSPLGSPIFHSGSEALFLVKLARMGTRHHVEATDVTLRQLPAERAAYEAFLGCRLRRGPALSVTFRRRDARRPFLSHNHAMWSIFEPELSRRLAELEGSAPFVARARAVLLEALPSGQVSVGFVARRLAVSQRTLQRRLRDEGTTFQAVVRQTRESLSHHYLGQPELSFSEIAYLLGFDQPSSFFRAFHAWTGSTPESTRRALRASG